ncbi:uncharacterized protein BJ212DRAFT_1476846 [Suillus subaureus]|uniref:Uncharacterized protein n=1 Tax=Suillus subaureus TaxID=48587 RepID=A0A9P7JGS1_9AGAM|nr:uncharacterized protein BJ212DRAFT_1476846 [Suillus subaureus]KAG1822415.1 hypothetical protein BJ212DRAFT_1476846 [Suillus subaureus]
MARKYHKVAAARARLARQTQVYAATVRVIASDDSTVQEPDNDNGNSDDNNDDDNFDCGFIGLETKAAQLQVKEFSSRKDKSHRCVPETVACLFD